MVKTYRSAPFINKLSLIGTDFFSYIFAISVGYWLSPLNDFSNDILEIKGSIYRAGSFLLAMLASIGILWVVYRHYTYRKPFWDELRDLFFTLFVISLANLALLVFAKVPEPLETWISVYGVLFVCFPIFRLLCKKILSLQGMWEMPSAIIGTGRNAFRAYKAIQAEKILVIKSLPLLQNKIVVF